MEPPAMIQLPIVRNLYRYGKSRQIIGPSPKFGYTNT